VLVLPHGIGFQKLVPDSRSARTRLSGVVPDVLLESGRAWLAVSHPSQEQQLLAAYPKAAGRTLLVGDPCFDELVSSRSRAAAYRAALGVAEHQRLVMVSSTWGPTSLLGRHPDLLPRLLAQLPYDEYRVGAIIHPNVWSGHGAWQIRTLLASALDAGLLLIPAVHTWRPALVAAHLVVGDHGSVTLYGAASGAPVLLGPLAADTVPGTAAHALAAAAPRLEPRGDLLGQVRAVMAGHEPLRYAEVAGHAFAEPGQALARLRTAVYRFLDLSEPPAPSPGPLALPLPDAPAAPVTSWLVTTAVSVAGDAATVHVSRSPAAVAAHAAAGPESAAAITHLACTDEERDLRLTESASVLLRRRPAPTAADALRWIGDRLAHLPGSLLAASALREGGVLVGLRDGRVVEANATGPAPDAGLPAAAVYACLLAELPLHEALVTLRVGGRQDAAVALRVRSAPPAG
jgi:hypothetical protein